MIEGQLILSVLILFISALVINIIYTRIIIAISHKKKWFDQTDSRKIHTEDTPRLGGIGFFTSFIIVSILTFLLLPVIPSFASLHIEPILLNIVLLFIGFGFVHYLGLIDDFRNIRAIYKLAGQILAGVLVVLGGGLIGRIAIPFTDSILDFGVLSGTVTIFWLISISNAVNLIDGMDGLAGGTAAIASLAISIVHMISGNLLGAILSIILFGSMIGFMFFNLPKAKIFMGDSGSLFLGFALASLIFINDGSSVQNTELLQTNGLYLTIILLFIPITDTIGAIIRRIRERKPVHHPDKEHIHHKLLNLGFSVKKALLIIYLQNLFLALAVVAWTYEVVSTGSSIIGSILLALSVTTVLIFFYWLHITHRKKVKKQT